MFVASGNQHTQVHFNDGFGWTEYFDDPKGTASLQLSGVQGGSLFLAGPHHCSILEVTAADAAVCSGVPSGPHPLLMVGENDGFVGSGDRLIVYDGEEWRQFGDPLPMSGTTISSLWADTTTVYLATNAGLYRYARPSEMPVLDAYLGEQELAAVWATDRNQAWVGTSEGEIYAYDGSSWQNVFQLPGDCPGIEQIWGDGTKLYVRTEHALHSVGEGGEITTLFRTECFDAEQLTSMWGLSATELFFSTQVPVFMSQEPCGGVSLHWTDGRVVKEF